MDGLMMDYQLNVPAILRRADELYGDNEIVSRLPDKSWHRYTYADFVSRTKQLVVALRKLGLEDGDRVGTFMWNHSQHLETYIGAPGRRLRHAHAEPPPPSRRQHVHRDARRRPRAHRRQGALAARRAVRRRGAASSTSSRSATGETPDGAIDYEDLLADADESAFAYRDIDERAAAAMCYTSGTTGRPKGVLYSHRAIAIHALTVIGCLGMHARRRLPPGRADVPRERLVLPVRVHDDGRQAGLPRPAPRSGDAARRTSQSRRSPSRAGVPTIWMGILQALDANPGGWDLSSHAHHDRRRRRAAARDDRGVRRAARPAHRPRLGDDRDEPRRHDLRCTRAGDRARAAGGVHAPRAAGAPDPVRRDPRARRRRPRRRGTARRWASSRCAARRSRPRTTSPTRAPTAGPRTAGSGPATSSRSTRTAYVEVQDRAKDLVKSGGEWISTVALENALMGHPAVAEAAVIAVPDEKWSERPLAVVVLPRGRGGRRRTSCASSSRPSFAKWWLPERFEFVDEIPKTAVGKFRKTALREQFAQQPAETA